LMGKKMQGYIMNKDFEWVFRAGIILIAIGMVYVSANHPAVIGWVYDFMGGR